MRCDVLPRPAAIAAVLLCSAVSPTEAFFGMGHDRMTRLAVRAAGEEMPEFFTAGAGAVCHASADPDLYKLEDLPQLRNREYPNHYLDLELLDGAGLPDTRYAFVRLCAEKGLDPHTVGTLPYAVVEATQMLAYALAEHRRWPDDPIIRVKCLLFAGQLSHYAQDLCQPLHTTIHYDGRVPPGGKSPETGIHAKVDALAEKAPAEDDDLLDAVRPKAFDELFPAVTAELEASHRLVDRVYALANALPDPRDPIPASTPVARFSAGRVRKAVELTASLYLTAWKISGGIELPKWHVENRTRQQAPHRNRGGEDSAAVPQPGASDAPEAPQR